MNKTKIYITLFLLIWTVVTAKAQKEDFNPLTVGVPSLTIAPDARGGGMGDIGAATEADVYSQYWNPAKYAFAYSKAGIGISYTPWLRSLVSDIDLAYLSGYYKLGNSDQFAIGSSLRYFSLGKIDLTTWDGSIIQAVNPYEMAFDLSVSVKTSNVFSVAAALRYIYSDLGSGIEDMYPGWAAAVDVAGYYNNYVMLGNSECLLGLGLNMSNLGSKISYDEGNTSNFLPANLRLGGSLLFPMDSYNTLSFNLDVNKYLVPTPPYTEGMTAEEKQDAQNKYFAISPVSGAFKSFADAPGGAKEEFREIMWSVGAEYAYDNQFFVRGGYHYENPSKGSWQYFSVGAGFKMSSFQVDAAYLISTVPSNPLDQTLRVSISFDMDGLKNLMK
ncbi:hypothetical protein FACS189426_00040 [Bacteroidia bacterium]|nr:hypothetical protein FACS189426_00040 [Bacteroidia bacterium]GHT86001.1 hypothetical protein FACS18947_5440 [Bacteroidia bacterium]